jgi:hypothetical protein
MLQSYTYDLQYFPCPKTQAADTLMTRPDFMRERCHVSQFQLTQLVVQDSTEWLREVAAETKDDSWSNDMVQIILSKDTQEHPLPIQFERHGPAAKVSL